MNVVIMMLGTTSTLWERGPWLGDWATQPSLAWHIEVRTMKRSKMTAAKNLLSPTMKSRAQTKHAIQGEEALAEWAPRLSAANAQKLVRLVRNCGIETVIGVAKEIPLRGLRRLSRGLLTHYENPPAPPADVVMPMLRGA